MIKEFEKYIEEGIVFKITPDVQRANNLVLESDRKYNFLLEIINKTGIDDDKANDYVESCYNILLFLIRSKMLMEGYNSSGQGAHEAEISFAKKIGISEKEAVFLDRLRYFRNGILYYGKRFDKEYAEKAIEFTKKIRDKLKNV